MKFVQIGLKKFLLMFHQKILNNFTIIDKDFDIIIDDASHNIRDILLTLPILFKKLNPGDIMY